MEKKNLTQQEIIEATRQGTIQGILKFISYLSLCVIISLGLIFSIGYLAENHNEYKSCKFFMERDKFNNSQDYICKYFGEKNYWEVWEKGMIERRRQLRLS